MRIIKTILFYLLVKCHNSLPIFINSPFVDRVKGQLHLNNSTTTFSMQAGEYFMHYFVIGNAI